MLGIHMSEGTAEGWFGPGKKSAIASIAVIAALLISVITAVILIAMNVGEGTNVSQPVAPAAPVSPASTPGTNPVVESSGAIEITAEGLVRELLANSNKYKKGTVFQVSGTRNISSGGISLRPWVVTSSGTRFYVHLLVEGANLNDQRFFQAFKKLNDGDWVVVRGVFTDWNPEDLGGAYLENVSLVSVTPTK